MRCQKILSIICWLSLLIAISCSNDDVSIEEPEHNIYETQDELVIKFAEYVDLVMEYKEFRLFLKEELLGFDDDNMVYQLAKNRMIGSQTLEEYFIEKTNDANFFQTTMLTQPTIQITIPTHIENWNANDNTLPILALGMDYEDDKYEYIYTINIVNDERQLFSLLDEPDQAVIVIKYQEG